MLTRKYFSVALVVGTGLLLASCSGGGSGSASSDAAGQKNEAAKPQEPVELHFMLSVGTLTSQEHFMEMFGNKIKAKFPYVTPVWVKGMDIDKRITAGEPIDILGIAQTAMSQYVLPYKFETDLAPLIKSYGFDLSKLDDSIVKSIQSMSKGGMYGIPFSADSINIHYNKGLFDKFGVPFPKDGMTWEETFDVARKMSRIAEGTRYYGLGMSFPHAIRMDSLAPAAINPTTNRSQILSDQMKRSFQQLADAFTTISNNEYDSKTWDYSPQRSLFEKQQLAMLIGPTANGARVFKDIDPALNWDMVTYPRYKDAPNVGTKYNPSIFFPVSYSKHKEAAFQVVAYVASEEMQTHLSRMGFYPAVKNKAIKEQFGKDLPFMAGKNLNALYNENAAMMPPLSPYENIGNDELKKAFSEVVLKTKDVNTALRDAEERINLKIAEELAKAK
jgi:multiple sugar transport system substrate-binding protein